MGRRPWQARAKAAMRGLVERSPAESGDAGAPDAPGPSAPPQSVSAEARRNAARTRLGTPSPTGLLGKIERQAGDKVTGWLFSVGGDVTPVLLVDGQPAELVDWPMRRPDISKALGTSERPGFRFRLPGGGRGAHLELFGLRAHELEPVDRLTLRSGVVRRSTVDQLMRAADLAQDPSCIAITCWESGHNPIGRAKVLYDVARLSRPAVLFAYSFEEFGTEVWPPLTGTDTDLVVVPWAQRERYHALMRDLGLKFTDVWMCKPRLPTFLMAEQIAARDARLVLDLDDNEHHFSLSQGSRRKPYGLPGIGRAQQMLERVPSRTVASRTLQEDFGGEVVRHARAEVPQERLERARGAQRGRRAPRVAFVGTVRPHKNLLAAARAISELTSATGREVEFHVLGDVSPPELKTELVACGAKVGGLVPFDKLPDRLAGMDCILTGFPSAEAADDAITRYQITAKIGDALAVGKPVLVPAAPSVRDLADTPGVYLFDEGNFVDRLCTALDAQDAVTLPEQFSLTGAATAFASALAAAEDAPRAGDVFSALPTPTGTEGGRSALRQDTILLIWKQHDAGLYGRRVDQVARAYKRAHPASRVVVLELVEGSDLGQYRDRARDYTSDAAAILSATAAKSGSGRVDADGVVYRVLMGDKRAPLASELEALLVAEEMLPRNTRVVLFPIIRHYEKLAHVLAGYRKIVDVVDNQFSWSSSPKTAVTFSRQYNILVRSADELIFNSTVNRAFFEREGILERDDPRVRVIPNWYLLPKGMADTLSSSAAPDRRTVVYTGNMSDRLDWGLLSSLSTRLPETRLVLVGSAARAGAEFEELLLRDNVTYLGPLNEHDSLRVLAGAGLAVMPHVEDDVSTYMNPLKVHMYEALGIPTVACDVPGLASEGPLLTKAQPDTFVEAVEKALSAAEDGARPVALRMPERAQEYVELLEPRS